MRYIIGIDEVGRGPLAGPVTVCAIACEKNLYQKLKRDKHLPPLGKDSKKLSQKSREQYASYLNEICRRRSSASRAEEHLLHLHTTVVHISNNIIDKKGISTAIKMAISQGLNKIKLDPNKCQVLLDGSLKAPKEFINQKTIIKGDEKEKIIAWASILAKVSRDSIMTKYHKKFPQYGFQIHKGYGTDKHRTAISKYGLSEIHRKTFCK